MLMTFIRGVLTSSWGPGQKLLFKTPDRVVHTDMYNLTREFIKTMSNIKKTNKRHHRNAYIYGSSIPGRVIQKGQKWYLVSP